jgi:putative peptidoglycan lipid II flippase
LTEVHKFALKFFSGTLLSRITGFLRDMAMAYAFGTESAIALFMVAFRLAHLARRLFGEGSMQNTFIPLFEAKKKENLEAASALFTKVSKMLAASLSLLILCGIGILEFIRFFPLSPNTSTLLLLTEIMLPSLLFISLFGLNAAFLQCEKSYFIPGAAPGVFNLVWIGAALTWKGFSPEHAAIGLSASVILACLAQWAITLPLVKKRQDALGTRREAVFSIRSFVKPLLLANIGIAASQINNAVDPLFALYADPEGPAWLWYAIRVQQLPLALIGIAFSSAFLPTFSRHIAQEEKEAAAFTLHSVCFRCSAFILPLSALAFAAAPSAINLLFGRGHFGTESVAGSSLCLMGYALGLLPMALVLVQAPALYALKNYRGAVAASWASMGANILLNSLMVFAFGWGAASVALATSLAAFLNWGILDRILTKRLPQVQVSSLKPLLLASLLSIAALWIGERVILGSAPSFDLLVGKEVIFLQEFQVQLQTLAWEGVLFLGSFAVFSRYFNVFPKLVRPLT